MDFSKLTTSDKVILGSAVAYLIFTFLPWYGISVGPFTYNKNGWDYFLSGIIPLILALVMAAQIAISRFAPDTKLPELPVSWGQVHLIAGVAALVLVVLRLIITSDVGNVDLDRKYGLFLALLATIGLAVGGYLKMQEEKGAAPAAGSGGSAPF